MRRRSDSWLNATQILKVAGFDKPQRTRVLEREVQKGEHEKVQGGYGKYQGARYLFFDIFPNLIMMNITQGHGFLSKEVLHWRNNTTANIFSALLSSSHLLPKALLWRQSTWWPAPPRNPRVERQEATQMRQWLRGPPENPPPKWRMKNPSPRRCR